MTGSHAVQATFEDLGTPLHEVTFVVVDLETTGGRPGASQITEVGAVKVRGGEVLGEFQTLVNPGEPIPAFIAMLTGISDAMVARAPRIGTVLPAFLEFAADSVLVAHNAGFDIGFLRAACRDLDLVWPGPKVLDTVHLARQLVTRDEATNHKLATLAQLFGATTTPDHRALHDARATVDVLHALLGRVGNLGVHTLEELSSYTARVTPAQRRKRVLADGLPSAPGVYVFKDAQGRALYVGTSVDIKRRVRSYFTSSEQRTRMSQMVGLATEVTPIVCQTALEAQVRELRLIAEHKPRFNRRSRFPERAMWLKLTDELFPRLSIVREVRDDDATYAGPFTSRSAAELAMAALHEVLPLRQCTRRLGRRAGETACALFDMGRCGGPCIGQQTPSSYAEVAAEAERILAADARQVTTALDARMSALSRDQRFEDAAVVRDRMLALLKAAARSQRLAPLARSPEVVAAARSALGGWEIVCVRYGRFAGTTLVPRGADPTPYIEALRESAEQVAPPTAPAPAALTEETEKVLAWLERPGVRMVHVDGEWACPVNGAGAARHRLAPPSGVAGFDRGGWEVGAATVAS
ncbi:DEDD exonuclease domain-containing protein [Calidifontibacter sp. DB0510]|uniref:DEDD exonuclease domain-containing protein n=1 Tax=Metallococcus carri TaxID=1656884 RepID=A0A967AZF9_9MICO|nr:DEDD exonuclease domain-containing protein [Metallococcus carri]NHN55949.1 DEDD exonuclease domain-containing protein [Metallococcus carri]NOP37594.1 DEDD exonuclease domain-containing protein [Calidifontibacter sp. DB2511S]